MRQFRKLEVPMCGRGCFGRPLFCELSFLSKPAGRPYVDKGALEVKGMLDYVIRNSSQNTGHSCK